MYRSRSVKRKIVRAPKRAVTHFKGKKKGLPRCAECGKPLHGVSTERRKSLRPSRAYGGFLCGNCVKKKIVRSVRV